jgi:Mn-dependent DtxR family transcriptional regulator
VEIQKERLFQLFIDYPDFLRVYLEFVSDHALILGDKIRHYVNKTIRESVVNFIQYEQSHQNSKTIQLNITKKALAEKIGVQRTSLSRELAKMKEDGLITYDSKTITLL